MSKSIHQTLKSVFGGKSKREIREMCDLSNHDHDVEALTKKTELKKISGRGKYKPKRQPQINEELEKH
jgi:hypothetical protein